MALLTTGTAVLSSSATGWAFDSVNNDLVPATLAPQDLVRGVGRMAGSGLVISRALVNQLCPVGLAMVQTVPGAETNTFTSRVSILGTLVNSMTMGDGSQVAGTFTAGTLNLLGRTVRITGGGTIGTTGTPNFTFDVGLGAGVLATTQSLAVNAAITTPANFNFSVVATVTTAGSSGVVVSSGQFNFASATNVTNTWALANSTPGTGLSTDLTAAGAITFNATCGTSNASNRVRLFNFLVEVLF
jgi:hypothetical protein